MSKKKTRYEKFRNLTKENLVDIYGDQIKEIGMPSLERVIYDYVYDILCIFNGHRGLAACALGVSVRTLRNQIDRMKEMGYEIPRGLLNGEQKKPEFKEATYEEIIVKLKEPDYCCACFPSNEYRLKYRDRMINLDQLHS